MAVFILLIAATLLLAYSNGANDNFKGVATLFGSNTTNYNVAIGWATITTFLGSIASIFLAQELLNRFTGRGLVPDMMTQSPEFLMAVAAGAGITVLLATVLGFPISTTHALVGALAGAGFTGAGSDINIAALGGLFFLPLLASPLIALSMGSGSYYFIHRWKKVIDDPCVCVNHCETMAVSASGPLKSVAIQREWIIDSLSGCKTNYGESISGFGLKSVKRGLHFFSAGMVSFARGLNDTPKIVALLLVVQSFRIEYGMIAVATIMAVGGLLNARKVAIVMSKNITPMDETQGLSANLVTSFLVIIASRFGLPVSTTHVSVGAISGIGMITGKADKKVLSSILGSWILTLPISAVIASFVYWTAMI